MMLLIHFINHKANVTSTISDTEGHGKWIVKIIFVGNEWKWGFCR